MPKIDLAMTVGPNQWWLEEAVLSVLRSTEQDWRLFVVGDGVKIEPPLPDDPRVVARQLGESLGRGVALSRALAMGSAPFIGWVDADDLLGDRALATTLGRLEANADSPLCVTGLTEFEERESGWRLGPQRPPKPFLAGGQPLSIHFALARRDAFERAGGVRENMRVAVDTDLLLRLEEQGPVEVEPGTDHYYWRRHRDSLGARNRKAQAAMSAQALEAARERRIYSNG